MPLIAKAFLKSHIIYNSNVIHSCLLHNRFVNGSLSYDAFLTWQLLCYINYSFCKTETTYLRTATYYIMLRFNLIFVNALVLYLYLFKGLRSDDSFEVILPAPCLCFWPFSFFFATSMANGITIFWKSTSTFVCCFCPYLFFMSHFIFHSPMLMHKMATLEAREVHFERLKLPCMQNAILHKKDEGQFYNYLILFIFILTALFRPQVLTAWP